MGHWSDPADSSHILMFTITSKLTSAYCTMLYKGGLDLFLVVGREVRWLPALFRWAQYILLPDVKDNMAPPPPFHIQTKLAAKSYFSTSGGTIFSTVPEDRRQPWEAQDRPHGTQLSSTTSLSPHLSSAYGIWGVYLILSNARSSSDLLFFGEVFLQS